MQNATVSLNHILFAVKTWYKNHADRVPIIQKTWARQTKFIRYFSDKNGMYFGMLYAKLAMHRFNSLKYCCFFYDCHKSFQIHRFRQLVQM